MDKQELINTGKAIHDSKIACSGNFKSLLNNMPNMKTLAVYDSIVIMCLNEGINCQALIDAGAEFKSGKISEEEFKKAIYYVLMPQK